nr:hypothetical protein [Tanacetum cinerariifolium]
MDECVSMSTPMATERLDADLQGTPTDQTTYRQMIEGLMYLTASRPDIAYATFLCARYQARSTVKHLKEVKRIFWYLRQFYNKGWWYSKDTRFELIAYSDADHARYKDDCKSTSGGLQFLVIWMGTQLLDYGYKYNRIPMYYDSKSAIAISCNPVHHSKTKDIDIRYHFIKEHVEKGTVELYFVGTEYQLADLFTKALPKECFEYLVYHIEVIMVQPQRQADVHQDELCPPNKPYALMDANKKIDLDNPLCQNKSKIMANILQNHPLRFRTAASSSVPWIYLGQFWHTLKEDGSKYRLTFVHDRKELIMTLDDFRIYFNYLELQTTIMNALLLLPRLHYSLEHPSTLIPYPRFIKLIVGHYMTAYPEISRRVHDKYHNLEHNKMVKSIFNSGKNKAEVGMKIPSWMITGKTIAPRSPNPNVNKGELSAQRSSKIIKLCIPPRRSTRLTPPTQIPTVAEVEDMIVQDTIQLSIAKQKIHDDLEAEQNVEKVKEHLASEEIKKMVKGTENEFVNFVLNSQNDPGTRDRDDHHDDAHPEREDNVKRQKISEHATYVFGESSSGQANGSEPCPSTLAEKVSQELVEEMLETVDEAKLRKKNPRVKIFYIKRQKEPGKPIEEVYSNLKIVQVIKTTEELGHEHKFVTKITVRRANGGVESYQQNVNLTAPTITFTGIEKKKMFSIVTEPIYGIIYKNSKKEKRAMGHQEIHEFCDATLKRVLEGLKSYNNDVNHGYVTPSLSKEDVECLRLFEEEIKERLKHRDQMRRWEMYVIRRNMLKVKNSTMIKKETPSIIDPWGEIVRIIKVSIMIL